MTTTIAQPRPTTETISAARERRERKRNSLPGQRRPRAIDKLTAAASPPSRTVVPMASLRRGVQVGWLTIESTPASKDSTLRARCICGSVITPIAKHCANGSTRSCGNLSLHGRH